MAADALAPCVTRSSAATVLTTGMYNTQVFVLQEGGCQLPMASVWKNDIEHKIILIFPKTWKYFLKHAKIEYFWECFEICIFSYFLL